MPAEYRHQSIAECIYDTLYSGVADPFMQFEVKVDDYNENESPAYGITIAPLGEREQLGTNERDDIEYETLIIRTTHSLGSDDLEGKSRFRANIRKLFHNKRIECDEGCFGYCRVDFGEFAIPRKWFSDNKSVSAMRVFTLVRESR
jgi:hypothetical protein